MYFASHGYPFLTIDVRGRGNSGGTFRPLIQEAADGFDVVEWLARQPYCNGNIAMWGGSYAGYAQWATARGRPPHLATIVPVASPFMMVDFPFESGMFAPYNIQWLTLTSGRTSQIRIFEDEEFWLATFRRYHETGMPIKQLDSLVGDPSPIWREWLSHPNLDAYWDAYNPSRDDYAGIEIPVLTITGIYDDDQIGAMEHYRRHMAAAPPAARACHFLVIGPWDHQGTRTPRDEVGGLRFGPASLVNLPQLHLDWYRWIMEDGKRPTFLAKPVAYYVSGRDLWRYAESLDAITAEHRKLFLTSTGGAAKSVAAPGALEAVQVSSAPDSYRHDPGDTSLADVEAKIAIGSLVDETFQHANESQVVYQSDPFAVDTEVSGYFLLSAFIGIDQPDTDFVVSVFEATSKGRIILLTVDRLRARYRGGMRTQSLVPTSEPIRYDFDGFQFTSRLVAKGSRLRLTIGASNSVRAEINYNTGGAVADETAAAGRPVVVQVFHDEKHPSGLSIPIAASEPGLRP